MRNDSSISGSFSDSMIMGLNAFSNRATWRPAQEKLFVDTQPQFPGKRLRLIRPPAPFVCHSPDPTIRQALYFGVHRGLKAFQPSRAPEEFKFARSLLHWRVLRGCWGHFCRTGDLRVGFAVLGADLVQTGRFEGIHLRDKSTELIELFEAVEHSMTASDLYDYLEPRWRPSRARDAKQRARCALRYLRGLVARLGRPSGTSSE